MIKDLTPQKPAEGISMACENLYQVHCTCGDPEHVAWIDIEHDPDCDSVDVSFYTEQTTDFWSETLKQSYDYKNEWVFEIVYLAKRFVNSIARRLLLTYDIWVKGKVTYQSTICMSKQQALNVGAALTDSLSKNLEKTS